MGEQARGEHHTMQPEISEKGLALTTTSRPLSKIDKTILRDLSCFRTRWVPVSEVLKTCHALNDSLESLLLWLRLQSVNEITQIGSKKVAGFSVIKAWMYDPNKGSVFIAFSPHLLDKTIDKDC
jgi:hypothetical protein